MLELCGPCRSCVVHAGAVWSMLKLHGPSWSCVVHAGATIEPIAIPYSGLELVRAEKSHMPDEIRTHELLIRIPKR